MMQKLELRKQPRTKINPKRHRFRRLKIWLIMTLSPFLAYAILVPFNRTLRWRAWVHPETEQLIKSGKPFILPFWHSDLLLASSISRNINLHNRTAIMIGLTRVGEIGSRFFEMLGFNIVRGSQNHRPVEAMEDLLEALSQGGIVGFAVDGPSGPAGVVKPGVVICAREAGVPVIPIGFKIYHKWRIGTWDNTVIPMPFSRCIAVLDSPKYEFSDEYARPYLTTPDITKFMEQLRDTPLSWEDCAFDAAYFQPKSEKS